MSVSDKVGGSDAHRELLGRAAAHGDSTLWNDWRLQHPDVVPDLRGVELPGAVLAGVDLSRANLLRADLRNADLREAKLTGANLVFARLNEAKLDDAEMMYANLEETQLTGAQMPRVILRHSTVEAASLRGADLRGANLGRIEAEDVILAKADLTGANLEKADLYMADLSGATLKGCCLRDANLNRADLRGANLDGADMIRVRLTGVDLRGANIERASIYGLSAWDVIIDQSTRQRSLGIAPPGQSGGITVDDLEIAQFINLFLENDNLTRVVEMITSKVVLILGAFAPPRKQILDRLRLELRSRDLTPVVFDFEVPESRSILPTVELLARMSRFVIVDLSDPRMSPMELALIAPRLTTVPIKILIANDQQVITGPEELARDYSWVLDPFVYENEEHLIACLDDQIVAEAEAKRLELIRRV